jgi:hypothetical protein
LGDGRGQAFPLAGKVAAEPTDGGGAEGARAQEKATAFHSAPSASSSPPPSGRFAATFPTRGKAGATHHTAFSFCPATSPRPYTAELAESSDTSHWFRLTPSASASCASRRCGLMGMRRRVLPPRALSAGMGKLVTATEIRLRQNRLPHPRPFTTRRAAGSGSLQGFSVAI